MDFFTLKRLVYAAPQFKTRQQMWHHCVNRIKDGDIGLEFGVWHGTSINHFANTLPDNRFHGFDSFEGLPEDWIARHPKGTFKVDRAKLKFAPNVVIHEGWFDQTLPPFLPDAENTGFIHIDCDIFSSTETILTLLEGVIRVKKPLLLFDEFYNYLGFEDHEFLAFMNFIERTQLPFEILGRNAVHQQVMIQML